MIKGGVIIYDSLEDLPTKDQCCLRVSHFFYAALVLLVASAGLLVGSYHTESLERLRTASAAILGLSTLLAVVCGLGALLVECRVQDRPCCLRKDSHSASVSGSSASLPASENKRAGVMGSEEEVTCTVKLMVDDDVNTSDISCLDSRPSGCPQDIAES